MMSLYFRFRPEFALFHGSVPTGSAESPWKVTSDADRERVVSQPGWSKVTFEE
jgi:hypothetical protein